MDRRTHTHTTAARALPGARVIATAHTSSALQ